MSDVMIYDPHARVLGNGRLVRQAELEREAISLIASLQNKRKSENREPLTVCAIHRARGVHRWFNIATEVPGGVHVENAYGGALNLAECLLKGEWRVATNAEEDECIKSEKVKLDETQREARLNRLRGISEIVEGVASATKPKDPK